MLIKIRKGLLRETTFSVFPVLCYMYCNEVISMKDFENKIIMTETGMFKATASSILITDMEVDADGKVYFSTQLHHKSRPLILLVYLLSLVQDLKNTFPSEITEMFVEKITVMLMQSASKLEISQTIKDISNRKG
jgi:hypothetical protein